MRFFVALVTLASPLACAQTHEPVTPGGLVYFLAGGDHDEAPALYRVHPNGDGIERLTTDEHAFVSDAKRTLALTIDHEIVIASSDLQQRTALAAAPGFDWHPKFSPDEKWVLFESARASFRDLYKIELATGALVRLTNNREGNFDGAWSPDGKHIAFASSRHGQLDLFVMNADGSDQTRLTRHWGDAIKPAWSADGRYIAYVSGRDGRDELYVVRPDGTALERIASAPASARVERYAWHPRDLRLVYTVRTADEGSKVHVVHVDKKRSWRLSKKNDDDIDPVWSPDGSQLLFVSKRSGRSQLTFMREDGTGRKTLEVGVPDVWFPRWFEIEKVDSK